MAESASTTKGGLTPCQLVDYLVTVAEDRHYQVTTSEKFRQSPNQKVHYPCENAQNYLRAQGNECESTMLSGGFWAEIFKSTTVV